MRAALVILLLAALPLVAAQGHQHAAGGMAMAAVLYDGPVNGRAVQGGFTHFGFALLDEDGKPAVHRDASFRVEQDGQVLFSTTDAHEYDGLLSFDVTFTRPGPYRVVAESEGLETGVFEGVVVPRANETEARVDLQLAPTGAGSNAVAGVLSILGPDDAVLPHTDAVLEVRQKGTERLAARTHLHIHEDPIQFTQGLDAPGDYVARVVAYRAFPSGRSPDLRAVVADFPFTAGPLAVPALLSPPASPPGVLEPLGERAEADGLALQATYDPQNQVGVGQVARVAGVVTNETGLPLAHVDFAFTLQGPRGLVFSSGSLHEYDGVFEYAFVPGAPGSYEGTLTARYDEAELSVPVRIQVVPPAVPLLGGGIGTVAVEGLEGAAAGVPVNLTFRIAGPQGPVQHSEVDVTVFHDGEAPVYQFKLHTHESGDTAATLVFPHPGDWKIQVDPLPTLPQAVVFQGPGGRDAPIVFAATVAAGGAAPDDDIAPQNVPRNTVPAWGLASLLAAGLCAALALRRRG